MSWLSTCIIRGLTSSKDARYRFMREEQVRHDSSQSFLYKTTQHSVNRAHDCRVVTILITSTSTLSARRNALVEKNCMTQAFLWKLVDELQKVQGTTSPAKQMLEHDSFISTYILSDWIVHFVFDWSSQKFSHSFQSATWILISLFPVSLF